MCVCCFYLFIESNADTDRDKDDCVGRQTGQLEPLLKKFTAEEERQMKRMLQRVDILANVSIRPMTLNGNVTHLCLPEPHPLPCVIQHAVERGVRLMVDAEQTYFQPAISRLTLEMQRKFNREKPTIFNTYQCYLKVTPHPPGSK